MFIPVNNNDKRSSVTYLTSFLLYFYIYMHAPFFPCLSRTFCFPGVSSPTTAHTTHYHTCRHLWTQGVLSSPPSDIYHSTVQLRLALTTIWGPWPQANQITCPLSAHPWCRLCPLLMDCRNYSRLSLLQALDISSTQLWRTQQGSSWSVQSKLHR